MPFLQHIFNTSLELGYCSIEFWDLFTISLKKLENNNLDEFWNYLELKFYHPIALLETLEKLLVTMLAKQIAYFAEIYNFLTRTHIKGRKCISRKHKVHSLIENIIAVWNKKQVTSNLFLDVSGIFNSVSYKCFLHNLRKRKFDAQIIIWIKSSL